MIDRRAERCAIVRPDSPFGSVISLAQSGGREPELAEHAIIKLPDEGPSNPIEIRVLCDSLESTHVLVFEEAGEYELPVPRAISAAPLSIRTNYNGDDADAIAQAVTALAQPGVVVCVRPGGMKRETFDPIQVGVRQLYGKPRLLRGCDAIALPPGLALVSVEGDNPRTLFVPVFEDHITVVCVLQDGIPRLRSASVFTVPIGKTFSADSVAITACDVASHAFRRGAIALPARVRAALFDEEYRDKHQVMDDPMLLAAGLWIAERGGRDGAYSQQIRERLHTLVGGPECWLLDPNTEFWPAGVPVCSPLLQTLIQKSVRGARASILLGQVAPAATTESHWSIVNPKNTVGELGAPLTIMDETTVSFESNVLRGLAELVPNPQIDAVAALAKSLGYPQESIMLAMCRALILSAREPSKWRQQLVAAGLCNELAAPDRGGSWIWNRAIASGGPIDVLNPFFSTIMSTGDLWRQAKPIVSALLVGFSRSDRPVRPASEPYTKAAMSIDEQDRPTFVLRSSDFKLGIKLSPNDRAKLAELAQKIAARFDMAYDSKGSWEIRQDDIVSSIATSQECAMAATETT